MKHGSVLRELWLVRETDTHAKIQDKAEKRCECGVRKCYINQKGQLGIGGCLLEHREEDLIRLVHG